MKIKVCGPLFGRGERRRGDEERARGPALRKVNLFGAWVI